ncbi:hypothetical protein ACFKHW_28930 [Bradyrhizobium lupini]|uniref:hypothetical protein n=1 Tax=Rhizobium lupini TaxID=136996 RepID=UPI0036710706
MAVVGSAIVLRYATIGDYFPAELIARKRVLNVLHFGWAFLVQYGTGLILEQRPAKDVRYPFNRLSDGVQCQCAAAAGRPGLVHRPLAQRVELEIADCPQERKSTDQSRPIQVVILSAEMVIVEADEEVGGELGLALSDFPPSVYGASRTFGRYCLRICSKQLVGYATCVARSTGMKLKMRNINERWLARDLLFFCEGPRKANLSNDQCD